jgi:hypothetical protein
MFYLELFRKLEAAKIRYMLVGGLAMNLHGVPRATMDVDLVLAFDVQNLKSFLALADALQLKPVAPVSLSGLLDPLQRKKWSDEKHMIAFALRPPDIQGPTVDVLIDPPMDVEKVLTRAVWRDVQGVQIPLISVEDLIQLKEKSGRLQDHSDIEHLRRIMKKPL